MGSKRETQRVWPTAGVLAISVLLHGALLFLPLPGPRHEMTRPERPGLRVELVAPPSSPGVPEDAPSPPRPLDPASEVSTGPDPSTPTETANLDEMPSGEPAPESASPPSSAITSEPAPESIRAQLLGAARNLGRESERSEKGQGLTYGDVPDLPSQPGWLHQYTGRVTPSTHRWRSNDGSRNARIVTASGQVVCVRTRAPTSAEMFNPWMSTAVPMMSLCGRERPQPVDQPDPWIRTPASAGRLEKEQ